MRKTLFLSTIVLAGFLSFSAYAQEAEKIVTEKDKIISIASEELKLKGYKLEDVVITYDDGNKLWAEQVGKYTELTNSPNFGIFQKGFMNNYRTVYFDYKAPAPDVWVFIDKDTGEVLDILVVK